MNSEGPENESHGWMAELRRRTVFRVAAAYVLVAWILMQGAEIVFPAFELSNAALRTLILVLAGGLPVAVILAWLIDVTPTGIRVTNRLRRVSRIGEAPEDAAGADHETTPVGRGLEIVALGACIPALAFVAVLLISPPVEIPNGEAGGARSDTAPAFERIEGRSLAVLPFEDLTTTAGDTGFFARGVHEDLLTRMASMPALTVVARTTVLAYLERPGGLQFMTKELGVGHVLQGTIRRSAALIRVTAQLTRTATGELLWAETFEAEPEDVLRVQADLAQRIGGALEATFEVADGSLHGGVVDGVGPGATMAGPAASGPVEPRRVVPAAFDAYLEARDLHRKLDAENREDLARARALYETAVRLDPGLAQAWAQLGILHAEVHWFGIDPSGGHCERARTAIERARAAQPDLELLPLAAGIDAYYCRSDFATADVRFAEAVNAIPGDTRALFYRAMVLRRLGRLEEALGLQRRALLIDPLNLGERDELPLTLAFLGRLEEARREVDVLLSLDPDRIRARFYRWHLDLELGGRPEEVLTQILATPRHHFGFQHLGLLERVAVLAGQPDTAIELLEAMPTSTPDPGFRDFRLARLQGWAGHAEERARLLAESRRKWDAVVAAIGDALSRSDRNVAEAMLAAAEGDIERAIELQGEIVAAQPIEADLVTGSPPLAQLLHYNLLAGHTEEAERILDRIEARGAFGAVLFHGWYHLLHWPEYTTALQDPAFRAALDERLPPYVERWLSGRRGTGAQIPIAF